MNKKITNKMLTKRKVNKFANGELLKKMNTSSRDVARDAFSGSNLGGSVGSVIGGLTTGIETAMQNAEIKDTSAEEAAIAETANTTFESGSYDNLQEAWNPLVLQRTGYTQKQLRGQSGWQLAGNTLKSMGTGFASGAQVGGIWGGIAGAAINGGIAGAGIAVGNDRAKREAAHLNAEATLANKEMLNNYAFAADNTYNQTFNKGLLNFAAYGGDLNMSGNFNNGLIFINEGGTHEENPFEGVQLGVDPEGVPNLVEEGEVVYNDYVFSNRLKPTKKQLEDNGLNKKYEDWTFAKIIEDLQKESADNPIDFISQNTLEDMISILIKMQEEIRMKKNKKNNNKFPWGGLVDLVEENIGPEESDALIESFWGAAKTPEQRLAIMELDPSNAYKEPENPTNNFNWQSLGRSAPVLTNAGTLISNMRKPDYSQADKIEKIARNIPGGSFTPLGDFINLESIDRNYLLNPMINISRSTARDLQNQGLNVGVMAGLLANNYNTQRNIGNALIQADQENINRAVQEATFNRGTNQTNAQMGLQTLAMDQQKAQNVLAATQAASQLRQNIDAQRSTALGKAIENISEDASLLVQEATQKEWLQMLIDSGALHSPKTTAKHGGKLLTKKRKK